MTFVGVFEIWEEDKIKYLTVAMEGDYIPLQNNMKVRQTLAEVVSEQYGYNCLDLIGVSVNGQMEWSDGHGQHS